MCCQNRVRCLSDAPTLSKELKQTISSGPPCTLKSHHVSEGHSGMKSHDGAIKSGIDGREARGTCNRQAEEWLIQRKAFHREG